MAGTGYNFALTHFDANDGFESIDFAKFNAKSGFFITEKLAISVGYDNFSYQNIDNILVKIGETITNNKLIPITIAAQREGTQ
jgi:hypothetical protein